jgi:hypothetical protein
MRTTRIGIDGLREDLDAPSWACAYVIPPGCPDSACPLRESMCRKGANMKDRASTEAQPWHPADEKPATSTRKGAPIGTHSFTGRGPEVGVPSPQAKEEAERSSPDAPGAEEPDPLAEPRTGGGSGLLGPRR